MLAVKLIIEGLGLGFLLYLICAIGIRNGAVGMVFLYDQKVQDRVIELGLTTREDIQKRGVRFRSLCLPGYLIYVLVCVYIINGARGFWAGFWQGFVILSIMNLIDRFLVDDYWVGHTNAWIIPGTEDLRPYITAHPGYGGPETVYHGEGQEAEMDHGYGRNGNCCCLTFRRDDADFVIEQEMIMKLGIAGRLFPLMFSKVVYGYTAKAVPELNIREFKKKHRNEYEAMVGRTPSVGSMKDNMFAPVMYLACYGFSYYKADPEHITMEVFDGMIDALCKSDMMKRFYKGKNCFDQKEIDKYVRGSERSKKREYPMDWVFDFSYDLSVPEYFVTHRECGVCKIGQQEGLMFLTPHMCVMDYPTIEYKGGKLLRTKTLGAGGDCCDFHVVKGDK